MPVILLIPTIPVDWDLPFYLGALSNSKCMAAA